MPAFAGTNAHKPLEGQGDTRLWTGENSRGRRWRNTVQGRMAPRQSCLRNLLTVGLSECSWGGMWLVFRAWKEAQLQTDEGACAPKCVSLSITFGCMWNAGQQPRESTGHNLTVQCLPNLTATAEALGTVWEIFRTIYLWPTDFQQGCQDHPMGKE